MSAKRSQIVTGIISAMPEEADRLLAEMKGRKVVHAGRREYHSGRIESAHCVLAFSRWGKVASTVTATEMISRFGVGRIVFSGVAGGVSPELRIGDVVIGTELWQHDMDARPLFERHEIPLLGTHHFRADARERARLLKAAREFARSEPRSSRPRVALGGVASGDKFFARRADLEELRARLPRVVCVEMEGAAVAQVCHEYGIPFAIARTISDSADEGAPEDFGRFIREVASRYSLGILTRYLAAR